MLFLVPPSCKKEHTETLPDFGDRKTVPGMAVDSVTTLISDSGKVRYKVLAAVWNIYDQADDPYWFFPEKFYFERFDDSLKVESVVQGDTARYFSERKLWELKNNVLVMNLTGEQFETNLLYWDQGSHRVYSDSFIRIEQHDQVLTGYGFESNEQLTKYKIFNIKGMFPIDSEPDSTAGPSTGTVNESALSENGRPATARKAEARSEAKSPEAASAKPRRTPSTVNSSGKPIPKERPARGNPRTPGKTEEKGLPEPSRLN